MSTENKEKAKSDFQQKKPIIERIKKIYKIT